MIRPISYHIDDYKNWLLATKICISELFKTKNSEEVLELDEARGTKTVVFGAFIKRRLLPEQLELRIFSNLAANAHALI